VKTLVESKGMKQQDAAAAIGRTPSFVSKILKLSDAHPLFLEHLKTTGQFLSAGQILAIEDRIKATVSEQEIQQVIQGLSQDQKVGNKEKKTAISVSESTREEPKKLLGNKRIDRFEIKHTGKPVTATSRGAVLTINFGSDARLEILSAQIRDLIEKSLGSELVGKKP
jgi:predicted transcriptional regulator